MKATLVNRTLILGAALAAALTANARPLQRADLPSSPAWVVHVDVDALRPTSIGQFLLGEMDKPENQAKLSIFQSISGFDLRSQLHGLTLYGTGSNPQDGVLIVYADFDAAKLTNLAKAAKEPENTPYKSHTIYSWLDEKKAKHNPNARVYAAIHGTRVILGQREATVAKALDAVDGAVPQLASSSTFAQLGAAGDISFIEAAAAKMDLPSADPNAALLKLSKQARVQLNESQGNLNATLTLEANDDAVAQQMLNVGQGLLALMKLQQDKPEAAKLANALAIKQDGTAVIGTLTLPSGDLVQLIKAGAARDAAKKAAQKKAAEAEAK